MGIDVVVVGGGYAGVMAANRLTRREDVAVTLINPRSTFVERIRLHQLVGGSHPAVVDYREVLAPRVRLVVDSATRIDAAGRAVELASGESVRYDYLVYAVGSASAAPRVPGAAEYAFPIGSLEEAQRLRPVLDAAPADAAVTVVGAGSSGIEVAAELAEQGRRVTLVCGGTLGSYLHPKGRRTVARRMAALGVTVVEDQMVTEVLPNAVRLDGREVASDVTIWTAGFGVPDLAARSGLRVDVQGRLLTDETLTSVDDVRIVAAGDSAAPSDLPFRMSCQAAVQLGPQAAETVLSRIAGTEPAAVDVGFVGLCVSLGRARGIFQVAARDDNATKHHIAGRLGALLKEFVCKGTVKQLAAEARKPGARNAWMKDAKRRERVAAVSAEPVGAR
ncbi:FAD-dependent oxidoreductase [Saccharothrix sp.]|uniref:NAD(P)/FAD-dependent oxidoreductase n=1 Tax=Saccharothrix sp. TaxID=1873460 RepID=UPI0028117696|nr:FAD-dependent oxidoreductase [Saccharothrix sp.]